jgi:FkbM family methyltransferase
MSFKPLLRFFDKTGLLKHLNLTTDIRVEKKRFSIPLIKKIGFAHCVSQEKWLIELMKTLAPYLRPDKSFIDVGVNVGQTLLVLKTLFPSARYYGFEPNPVCIFYVNELIRRNAIADSTLFPFGLSDKAEIIDLLFFYTDHDDSTATILSGFRSDAVKRHEKVVVFKFDALPERREFKPGIVKIDVEGSEWEVIKGMSSMVREERPCIICEVLPTHHDQRDFRLHRQSFLEEFLSANDYLIYHIRLSGKVERMQAFNGRSKIEESNYLFLPKEQNIFG